MKKQIVLALTLAAFLISACNDDNSVTPAPPYPQPGPEPIINSIYPNAGPSGSSVAIIGENFSPEISNNYVMFGPSYAEITYVGYGILNIRVPDLPDGDYEVNLTTGGQARRAPQIFTITSSQH
jgi:hypothetical protein